jgi:putative membrane protein
MPISIANFFVGVVAFVHLAIVVAEMYFWRDPRLHERLGFNGAEAKKVAPIVANVGLYNGFLAAGLIWSLCPSVTGGGAPVQTFFLACVIVAGLFGAVTVKWTTLLLQTVPAAIAMISVWMARAT